jgi:hypothetical protein
VAVQASANGRISEGERKAGKSNICCGRSSQHQVAATGKTQFEAILHVQDVVIPLVVATTFKPDVDGTGGPDCYRLTWEQVDGSPTGGSADVAKANVRDGVFWVSRYVPSRGVGHAYAGLGVWIIPVLQSCRMLIRPYVNWQGWDILDHRVLDPSHGSELVRAIAGGHLGIYVLGSVRWQLQHRRSQMEYAVGAQ